MASPRSKPPADDSVEADTADTAPAAAAAEQSDRVLMKHPAAGERSFSRRQARVFAKSGWEPVEADGKTD